MSNFDVATTAHLAGTIVLALYFVLLARHDQRPYLRDWTAAWVAQALALASLIVSQLRGWPASLSLYLLLETTHGVLLCAAAYVYVHGGRWRARGLFSGLLAIWAGVAPFAFPAARTLESIQFGVLALTYLAAALILWRHREPAGIGLRITTNVLALLGLVYLQNAAVFAWYARSEDSSLLYLEAAPFGVLFLQMLLGLGMATAVMEAAQQALASTNAQLTDAERRLKTLAETDPLTGCFNRRVFRELVDGVRARGAEQGAVLLVDMDGLKAINDREGHIAGDLAIRAVADAIRARTRDGDLVVRWGGDEFVVVMPGVGLAEATARRDGLGRALDEGPYGASLGLAAYGPQKDIMSAVQEADEAMYRDKAERKASLRRHATSA